MKIRLIGELHPELQVLGCKEGDEINAEIDNNNNCAYFTLHNFAIPQRCVAGPDNYEIVEGKPRFICATCGTTDSNQENGFCINGHDDWLERRDFSISEHNQVIKRAMKTTGLSLEELMNKLRL